MKIKVCGITREEDIAELLLAGVDFIGFNFIKSSPRYIDINWAVNIINKYNIQKKAVPLCEISDLKTVHHKLKNLDLPFYLIYKVHDSSNQIELIFRYIQLLTIESNESSIPHKNFTF